MKATNRFFMDMLDWEMPEAASDVLWKACQPTSATAEDGAIVFHLPFQAQQKGFLMRPDDTVPRQTVRVLIRAYGPEILRLSAAWDGSLPDDAGPMLEWHSTLKPEPLTVTTTPAGWEIRDSAGAVRLQVRKAAPPTPAPPGQMRGPGESWDATALPDGKTAVPFMAWDTFFPDLHDSLPLAFVTRNGQAVKSLFALHARPEEHFAGTGERFAKMDLAGRTILLENADGLGVNSRRCYKNVPFLLSSRPYGLFLHTSAHVRLSLADISTRAAQGLIEDRQLDLFFVGGGAVERILYNYRRLTGFPRPVPRWSYGTWMSRMSYRTDEEVRAVAARLREGGFPCDVIHLDIGWYDEDWICDWQFGKTKFPDPARFLRDMRAQGYRISLWQLPHVAKQSPLFQEVISKGFAFYADSTGKMLESQFSGLEYVATLDLTNPDAVRWYQAKLAALLKLGASAIKSDFGEHIHVDVPYRGLPYRLLHNLYALLYQKAVFEITQQVTGEGIEWARSAWAGSQRYPVHWSGDAACSWDGLAGCIRGGLHFGVSGFGFWSHDVPGFHGVPDFMQSRPANDLFVRWTQVGVFTSHLRYHGAHPREPYEYPAIADLLRQWLRLRYALIPYLEDQGRKLLATGMPLFRALVFHHADDPVCWHIDDQFYCGDSLLIAPILNSEGVRDIYLPAGEWVDLWTGKVRKGPRWLKAVKSPLQHIPVFAWKDSRIPIYPEPVQCTDEMDARRIVELVFDTSYRGLSRSILGKVSGL